MSKRDRDGESRRGARTVVPGAAVVVVLGGLLTACGDDGGDEVASVEDFCTAIERVNVELDSRGWFEGGEGDVVLQAVSGIDTPEDISGAWETVIEMTERRNASEDDPEEDLDAEAAAERVLSYADVQCSVDLGSS